MEDGISGNVQRAGSTGPWAFHDVEIDHGRFHARVAHEVLDSPDVSAALEQMSCKAVAHAVACGGLGDVRLAHGILELALHGRLVEVVSGNPPGAGMRTEGGGGKQVLPMPFARWRRRGRRGGWPGGERMD